MIAIRSNSTTPFCFTVFTSQGYVSVYTYLQTHMHPQTLTYKSTLRMQMHTPSIVQMCICMYISIGIFICIKLCAHKYPSFCIFQGSKWVPFLVNVSGTFTSMKDQSGPTATDDMDIDFNQLGALKGIFIYNTQSDCTNVLARKKTLISWDAGKGICICNRYTISSIPLILKQSCICSLATNDHYIIPLTSMFNICFSYNCKQFLIIEIGVSWNNLQSPAGAVCPGTEVSIHLSHSFPAFVYSNPVPSKL